MARLLPAPVAFGLALIGLGLGAAHAEPAPEAKLPTVTVEVLNAGKLDKGRYRLEAYVLQLVPCPPCPPRAVCETCLPDHIFISDQAKQSGLIGSRLSAHEMIVLPQGKLPELVPGRRYRLTIETQGPLRFSGKYIDSLRQSVQLLSFEALAPG